MESKKQTKRSFKYIKNKLIIFYYDNIYSIFNDSLERTRMQVLAGIPDVHQDNAELYRKYDTALKYVNQYDKKPSKKEDLDKNKFIKTMIDERRNVAKRQKDSIITAEPMIEISQEEEMNLFKQFIEDGKKTKLTNQ